MVGTRLPWPSAPTTFTTMDDVSGTGESLCCQGITEPACKTATTLIWWGDKRFPLLPGSVPRDPHTLQDTEDSSGACTPGDSSPGPHQPLAVLTPISTKRSPETRAAHEPGVFQHIPEVSNTMLGRSPCSSV